MHYPTDVSLLWDAMRCLLRVLAALCEAWGVGGWRQSQHLTKRVRKLFQRVRAAKQRRGKKGQGRVRVYLQLARQLAERAEVESYLRHAWRQMDQIERRVLQGEQIPQEEKVFSIFQPHTRWCAKGKAGVAVELGVPLAVVESRQQFVLHWQLLWEEQDVEVACPLVETTQQLYPQLEACSFDKGFHSPANQRQLEERLKLSALPRKGRLSQAQREREQEPAFREARREHPAVESAINNLEQRGLGRVRAQGAAGFERMVGLSVLAGNLHRIGLLLQRATPPTPDG